MSVFGSGSNSNGQFWYGSSVGFPGFIYKKMRRKRHILYTDILHDLSTI